MILRGSLFGLSATALLLALVVFPRFVPRAGSLNHLETRPAQPVLVELFTSEGCSSCPPADHLLSELDRRQDVPGASVVVLSEHVDYWNHLGWRDPYSLPLWSERQSAYARQFHLDSVYTPQAVVDGSRQVVGSDANDLRKAIQDSSRKTKVSLEIVDAGWKGLHNNAATGGDGLETRIATGPIQNAILYAVIADDMDRSTVANGENAGRRLEHVAVARVLIALMPLRGEAVNRSFEVAIPAGLSRQHLRLVVLIQDKKSGEVLGIASRSL